jgi:3-hydroxybutyryl-CoA dehydratase
MVDILLSVSEPGLTSDSLRGQTGLGPYPEDASEIMALQTILPEPHPVRVGALRTYGFDDLFVGMRETLMRTVMERDVADFAHVSGDNNPIHLCDSYAAASRFGQRIAHGMFTASMISALIGTKLPGPGALYLGQTLRFCAPVKIGDVVCAVVEVAEMIEKGRRVRLDCHCLVDGKAVLEGEALIAVPKPGR